MYFVIGRVGQGAPVSFIWIWSDIGNKTLFLRRVFPAQLCRINHPQVQWQQLYLSTCIIRQWFMVSCITPKQSHCSKIWLPFIYFVILFHWFLTIYLRKWHQPICGCLTLLSSFCNVIPILICLQPPQHHSSKLQSWGCCEITDIE